MTDREAYERLQRTYAAQGYCAVRSPRGLMCTKRAGHNDPLHPGHHAEDAPGHVVEEWAGGDVERKPLQCMRCGKEPHELDEYRGVGQTPADYVRAAEGTLNRETGFFVCTPCYIDMGQPVGEGGTRWRAGDPIVRLSSPPRKSSDVE